MKYFLVVLNHDFLVIFAFLLRYFVILSRSKKIHSQSEVSGEQATEVQVRKSRNSSMFCIRDDKVSVRIRVRIKGQLTV